MLDYYVARLEVEERRRAAAEARLVREIKRNRRRPARRALGQGLVRVGLWLLDVDVARAAAS